MKRQWLYNAEGGTLFESEKAIAEALKQGYVDTPAKVGQEKPKKQVRSRKKPTPVDDEDL